MENKIVIGVLAYNEEKFITKVMSELSSLNLPLLVIDDCSTDKTSSKLENLNINNMAILTNHKNLGAGGSTKALLKKAEQEGFSFLIKVDGDDQFLIDDVVKTMILLNRIGFGKTESKGIFQR